MPSRLSLRNVLLGSLIGALCLSAVVGIYIFVVGDFGETEIKILITTLSLAYFSVTSLGCTVVLERGKALWLTVPGLLASAWGFLWSLLMIWAEWDPDPAEKTMLILVLFAFSFAQSSLLALPRLPGQAAWIFPAALVCIFALAALLSTMLVFELEDEFLFRLAGVLGILDASATLSIPILHKLGGKAPAEELPRADHAQQRGWRVELVCPRCGHRGVYPAGLIECPHCSLALRLTVLDAAPPAGTARFQFSLRGILLVFLVAALPLGWIGFRLHQLRRQAAVVEALEPLAPKVLYRYGNLFWVSLEEADPDRFDPAMLARLKELPKLEHLSLSGLPITDGDLAYLRGAELRTLDLRQTSITDAGLVHLYHIRGLRRVYVGDTSVTPAGAQSLTRRMGDVQVAGVARR
jgi:hypothetical protein